MLKLACPSCGAEIQFKSRVSAFGVCSFCKSMVVRHDLKLETLGKMAELPPDMSPIQLGTRGKFESTRFEVLGRLRIGWSDGAWNEWYCLFEDGRDGWLAEAQGHYMVSFTTEPAITVPPRDRLQPGQLYDLVKGREFEVEDIKEATCIGSEGELPFKGPKGRKSTSVDLAAAGGHFACLDYSDEGTRLYVGKYVEFEQLALSGMRELDGW